LPIFKPVTNDQFEKQGDSVGSRLEPNPVAAYACWLVKKTLGRKGIVNPCIFRWTGMDI